MEPHWFSTKSSHSGVSPGFLLVLCFVLIGQCVADECERCYDKCQCPDNICDLVCENECGPGTECKSQLDACYSGCGNSTALPEVALEGVDEDLMDTIVAKKIKELTKSKKNRIGNVLRSVGLDSQEAENFGLIQKCLDDHVPMEFVVDNPNQNQKCAGIFERKNSSSTFGMALARGCDVQWISLYNRANFYETCLKNYDMMRLFRDVRKHTGMLDQITRNIKRYAEDFSDAEIAGGAQLVGGGLLVGLGVIIPPLAPFTSIVGTILTLTGTGTSLTATLLGASWTDQEATNFKHEMEHIEERYTDVAQLISLFLKSAKAVSDVAHKTRVVNNLQEAITTAYINAVPGAIATAKLTTMAGAKAYATFAPKLSQKLASTSLKAFTVKGPQTVMIGKLTGKLATKLTPVKEFFGKVLGAKIAGTTVRGTISTAGKLIVPGISLASGVYSIITGSDSSNVHNGLLYEVQMARRELEYNTDEVISTYQELGLVQSGNTSWRSSADISLIDYHTITASTGVRLQIESVDADGLPLRCETSLLGEDHSGGGWSKMGCCKELGQCGEFFIFNHTARIRIIEGTAEIDAIQIGINGNFLPSISCDGKISASGASPSEWMACSKKVGMRKFKTHTSNKKYAGTSNSLYFTFQIERNDGTSFSCSTGNQINRQPKVSGESNIYEPHGDSFGTCDDAELAHALLDRNEKKPGDNIKVTVESVGYWKADQWHADLLKAYFLTDLDKMMVITCELCNAQTAEPGQGCGEGWGVWLDSGKNNTITFNCHIMKPKFPERTLQSFRVKVCDLRDAGSDSDVLRLQICNEGAQHTWNEILTEGHTDRLSGKAGCCMTNLFGKNFVRNKWSDTFDGDTKNDDGGEVLGQCESFPLDGTAINLRWTNEHHGAVCVEEYEFFGGSKAGKTSVRPIPIISCTGMQTPEASPPEAVTDNVCQHWSDNNLLWGDSKQGYCQGWSYWYDWTRVNSYCSYVNQTNTLKNIAIRVCDDRNAGSSAKIKAVIQNLDGERCTTDVFQTGGLKPGQYIDVDNIGKECKNLEIKEGIAEAWIVNADQKDNLCLSDVYFDISSSDGSTDMLKCRLNDKDPKNFKINVIDNEEEAVFAIPMICR